MAEQHQITFATTHEADTYLTPAKAAVERGFEVVIYGHTHLAKDFGIKTPGGKVGRYLNTGTWADLMRMPDAVFGKDDDAAAQALDEFVADPSPTIASTVPHLTTSARPHKPIAVLFR